MCVCASTNATQSKLQIMSVLQMVKPLKQLAVKQKPSRDTIHFRSTKCHFDAIRARFAGFRLRSREELRGAPCQDWALSRPPDSIEPNSTAFRKRHQLKGHAMARVSHPGFLERSYSLTPWVPAIYTAWEDHFSGKELVWTLLANLLRK